MKPYQDVQFKYKDKLLQIQIWGHPERALLLTTPLEPLDLLLDALPSALITDLGEALVEKFCLDPLHLIFLLTRAGLKVEDSYIQLQLQWDGDKFSHCCQHYVSIKEMNHFMRRGVWLGESASFFR